MILSIILQKKMVIFRFFYVESFRSLSYNQIIWKHTYGTVLEGRRADRGHRATNLAQYLSTFALIFSTWVPSTKFGTSDSVLLRSYSDVLVLLIVKNLYTSKACPLFRNVSYEVIILFHLILLSKNQGYIFMYSIVALGTNKTLY